MNKNVRVEQKTNAQSYSSGFSFNTSQRCDVSAINKSSEISTFPIHDPSSDFHAFAFTGLTRASGLPRFVIVIVPPRVPTSSNSDRHFALNSVTLTTRFFIVQLYHRRN